MTVSLNNVSDGSSQSLPILDSEGVTHVILPSSENVASSGSLTVSVSDGCDDNFFDRLMSTPVEGPSRTPGASISCLASPEVGSIEVPVVPMMDASTQTDRECFCSVYEFQFSNEYLSSQLIS